MLAWPSRASKVRSGTTFALARLPISALDREGLRRACSPGCGARRTGNLRNGTIPGAASRLRNQHDKPDSAKLMQEPA